MSKFAAVATSLALATTLTLGLPEAAVAQMHQRQQPQQQPQQQQQPQPSQPAFSFYGLRFGMSRAEIGKLVTLQASDAVTSPGHGMSTLSLEFDRNDLLMEIRAGYARPDEPMRAEGLRRALTAHLVQPVRTGQPGLEATIDEYGNRAGLTVVIRDKGLREENIHFYENQFLSSFE
jgi:hypothetical protein